jgi:hypothetical protein
MQPVPFQITEAEYNMGELAHRVAVNAFGIAGVVGYDILALALDEREERD